MPAARSNALSARRVAPALASIRQDEMIGLEGFLRLLPSPKGIEDLRNACRKIIGSGILCGKNAQAGRPLTWVLLCRVVDVLVHDGCLQVRSSSLVGPIPEKRPHEGAWNKVIRA